MNKRSVMKIAAPAIGLFLAGALYGHFRRKRKDAIASELLREVTRIIKPATSGLLLEDAFDIHYADEVVSKVKGTVLKLKASAASRLAQRIEKAWGAWYQGGDDEDKVYGVFRELKDKVQVSQVAGAYQELYKKNLIDKLHDRFTKSEVQKVLDIVKPLPSYRTL
ncbi:MAG: hypothetical protein KDD04_00850 [Sinomicrobium sp.]|nr:hypothetical protein [Sinomicrobium sp.]